MAKTHKIKKASQVLATPKGKNGEQREIPTFRYVQDVLNFVQDLSEEATESHEFWKAHIKASFSNTTLAALSATDVWNRGQGLAKHFQGLDKKRLLALAQRMSPKGSKAQTLAVMGPTTAVDDSTIGTEQDSQLVKSCDSVAVDTMTPSEVMAALQVLEIGNDPEEQKALKKHFKNLKTKVDPGLDKVVVPKLRELKSQYAVAHDLYQKYQTLEAVETQLSMQFADARDLKRAQSGVLEVKNRVAKALKEVLAYLSGVAEAHVPRSFEIYEAALRSELSEALTFSKSQTFLYVHLSEAGSIVFTYYIMLEDVLNEDQEEAPTIYVALQWNQGSPGTDTKEAEAPYVKIFLDHEYELPKDLESRSDGQTVSSVQDALRALGEMLAAENFASSLGVVPLSLALKMDPRLLKEQQFSLREWISRVAVDDEDHSLTFVLKKDVVPQTKDGEDAARQLGKTMFVEVKSLLKSGPTQPKLRTQIQKSGQSWALKFFVVTPAGPLEIDTHELEYFRDRFGLNDSQVRKIQRVLTEG